MNRFKKLSLDIILITIGQTSTKLISLLLLPLFTSILSTKEYGIYDLILTTISLLSPVLTMVVYEAVMRFCLDKHYEPSYILTIGCEFTLAGTIIFALLTPFLKRYSLIGDNSLLTILYFFVINMHNVLASYLKGIDRVKLFTLSGVVSSASIVALNLLFVAALRLGVTGFLLGGTIGCVISWGVILTKCNFLRSLINPFNIEKKTYRAIMSYTLPLIPNSISWWVSNSSDKLMLKMYVGVSCVGIYSVSYKISTLIAVISSIFISAWQISAVKDFGSKESIDFFSKVYRIYSAFNILLVSALISSAKLIGTLLYSGAFFQAWKPSMIILMAYMFSSMSAMLGSIYTSSKKTKPIFYSTATAAAVNIILNYFFIKAWDMHGAAIATCVSYMVIWIIRLIHSRRIIVLAIDYLRDIVSYVLIIIQIVIMYFDSSYALPASLSLMAVISAINIKKLINRQILQFVKIKQET